MDMLERMLTGAEGSRMRVNMNMKRLKLDPKIELCPPRRASRVVSTYGKFVQKREYNYHLPPSGTDMVGDLDVWDVLLMDGKPSDEHPTAFRFGDKLLHQPTFLEGQEVRGKQICCVWDVDTGDVYYRGPQGPPLDLEKMAQRKEAKRLAEQEADRAAEERRIKMDELEAKMRAEIEMRAKLEAEAKLKLERQGQLKQEMLEKARAEIEARVRASGALPNLTPRPADEVQATSIAAAQKAVAPDPTPAEDSKPAEVLPASSASAQPAMAPSTAPANHEDSTPKATTPKATTPKATTPMATTPKAATPKAATAADATTEAKTNPPAADTLAAEGGEIKQARPVDNKAVPSNAEEEELDQVRCCLFSFPHNFGRLESVRMLMPCVDACRRSLV